MELEYIIVQAGGKGTRLEYLTRNKPKALVPVFNLPMLFHLFQKFPDKKYIVIADYKRDALRSYIEAFARVKCIAVDATGAGTCSGIKQSLNLLPDNAPFMIIWSDLILPAGFQIPAGDNNYIGISQSFPCRWKYENNEFAEEASAEFGIAGLFIIKEKALINDIPESGELVRYFSNKQIGFVPLGLAGTKEFGLLSEYRTLEKEKCRPFNKITVNEGLFIKEPIDEQGIKLAELEKNWYEYAKEKQISVIPDIRSYNPLTMERISGKNIYEYRDLSADDKRRILRDIINNLKQIHQTERITADPFSIKNAYYGKTIERLAKVRDLIPFTDKKEIEINGRVCRNIYFYKRDFERALDNLYCGYFTFIHGDCTFSNIILRDDKTPVFIDPRGYFGYTKIFGDPNYDIAKLYYSIAGNYDRFNLMDFRLMIDDDCVGLQIESNLWEDTEQDFFVLSGSDPKTIKLLHAVIWLSLTTYAWQDYDSICGAFYNGLYYLEEVL